jgi:UDP:flavonoid glycosyltransferase YjiC (YdhE family)
VPEITPAQVLPLALAQPVFELFRSAGYALHVMPVNKIRRKHGLAPLPLDFRWALMEGDATLYADIPEVIPTLRLPTSHRFVGPIPWSPSLPSPNWWPEVEAAAAIQPVVYVNLGSSGVTGGLARVLEALRSLPVSVIAATAGRGETLPVTQNSRVAEYLPGDACAQVASVVICNGGSPGTYQALAEGKPVIGLAANMDQFLNMTAVQDASCGRLLRACSCSEKDIRSAVVDVLSNPRLGEGTLRIRRAIADYDPFTRFRDTLGALTGAEGIV